MIIEFSNQDILVIYEKFKVESVKLDILSAMSPNPIHPDSYRGHMDAFASIVEKIEAEYPQFLDDAFQGTIREKAKKQLKVD